MPSHPHRESSSLVRNSGTLTTRLHVAVAGEDVGRLVGSSLNGLSEPGELFFKQSSVEAIFTTPQSTPGHLHTLGSHAIAASLMLGAANGIIHLSGAYNYRQSTAGDSHSAKLELSEPTLEIRSFKPNKSVTNITDDPHPITLRQKEGSETVVQRIIGSLLEHRAQHPAWSDPQLFESREFTVRSAVKYPPIDMLCLQQAKAGQPFTGVFENVLDLAPIY